jgi:hypothetical protein
MAMNPDPNQYTPKINEAIAKAVKKNTSPYDQLTNINRGKPNVAPSPTATPMVPQDPNLRKFINQFKREEKMMGRKSPNPFQPQEPMPGRFKSLMYDTPLDRNPFFSPPEENMPTAERNPFYNPKSVIPEDIMTPGFRMQQPQIDQDMIRKILANLPPGIDPKAVQANPLGYLQQMQAQQQGLQPGMGQPMGTQNTPQYMATYDPSPFSSAQPMGGGLGQQSPMMPQAGLGALAAQPSFGGNMLGQKNAFS